MAALNWLLVPSGRHTHTHTHMCTHTNTHIDSRTKIISYVAIQYAQMYEDVVFAIILLPSEEIITI